MGRAVSLHVGLNRLDPARYGTDASLDAAEADALAWKAFAEGRGFDARVLLTAAATHDGITGAVRAIAQELAAHSGEGDAIVLITYSGHGTSLRGEDASGDEGDGADEAWCAYDGLILDDELGGLWADFPAGARVVVVADSCHSGSVAVMGELPDGVFPPNKLHPPPPLRFQAFHPRVLDPSREALLRGRVLGGRVLGGRVAVSAPGRLPDAKGPVVSGPVVKGHVAGRPVSNEPVAKAPVTKVPVAKAPVAKAPVAGVSPAKVPVARAPVSGTPAVRGPAVLPRRRLTPDGAPARKLAPRWFGGTVKFLDLLPPHPVEPLHPSHHKAQRFLHLTRATEREVAGPAYEHAAAGGDVTPDDIQADVLLLSAAQDWQAAYESETGGYWTSALLAAASDPSLTWKSLFERASAAVIARASPEFDGDPRSQVPRLFTDLVRRPVLLDQLAFSSEPLPGAPLEPETPAPETPEPQPAATPTPDASPPEDDPPLADSEPPPVEEASSRGLDGAVDDSGAAPPDE